MSEQERTPGSGDRRGNGSRSSQNYGGGQRNEQRGRGGNGGSYSRNASGNRNQRSEQPRSGVSAARMVAYDVLRDVDEREAYANLALPSRIREANLDSRDAGLATELVAGTLRGRGRYDRIIEIASGRDLAAVDPRTRNVLRLGVHQLLSMRTAPHAAVNESVELQRRVANVGGAGFVNGVLREVGRADTAEWDQRITESARNRDEAQALRTAHPTWIVRAFRDALRAEGRLDELEDLLNADNTAPQVNLVLLSDSGIDVDTAEAIGAEHGLEVAGPSPLGLQLDGGDPSKLISMLNVPEGTLRVQDQGSQIAALALTRARPIVAGERWLDLCAGPGGKTAVLGAEAKLAGATVRANEVAEHRAELVRRASVAAASVIDVVSHDGRAPEAFGDHRGEAPELFDRILVDAPCSGLGALRRRPEARWRKQPSDLPELTTLQAELLDAAVAHLAVGGLLAYVTCSPHLAETRVVVNTLLKRSPKLREISATDVVQSLVREPLDLAGDSLSVQLWPHRHGTDAMFIALLTLDA